MFPNVPFLRAKQTKIIQLDCFGVPLCMVKPGRLRRSVHGVLSSGYRNFYCIPALAGILGIYCSSALGDELPAPTRPWIEREVNSVIIHIRK